MQIRFGNLSIAEFEKTTEVQFTEEDKTWMEERRIDRADFLVNDKFHIFGLPLGIVAGSDVGPELVERLKKYHFERHFYVETKEPGSL